MNKSALVVVGLLVAGAVVAIAILPTAQDAGNPGEQSDGAPLIVYCAHDALYSERILNMFEEETGIPVDVRFDTEATKSLGLVNLLIAEKDNPRCDVFWNNQVLGTLDLLDEGILHPYQGPGYERIPAAFKDPEGRWTGFGARLRVFIVNTESMEVTEEAVEQSMQSDDLSRFAIAKPLYGTTLTHYSLLWHLRGGEELKQWHQDCLDRGMQIVTGNATVKNLVASGVCDFGWTDTDDFFIAKDEGLPVDLLPVRVADGATISIPNSVSIIRGSDNLERAQKLVDFLLSEKIELELASSQARQIPLGSVDESQLSEDVRQLKEWADQGYDLNPVAAARTECLAWLKTQFLE